MMGLVREPFGHTPEGVPVECYRLTNANGMQARILTYGAVVTHLFVPDRTGRLEDVVLGYDTLTEYLQDRHYLGAIIGRFANRIANGRFKLDGSDYQLTTNDGPHALHGGTTGFSKVVWRVRDAGVADSEPRIELTHVSADCDQGFPGNMKVSVLYTLTASNTLRIQMTAVTDKATVVNLTHHSYFNLRGHGDIVKHALQIHGDRFTVVDETLRPTGELRPVAGTPFDFRQPVTVSARLDADDEQLRFGKGYDHNWVVGDTVATGGSVSAMPERLIATLFEPESGRCLEVCASAPGLQFYGGNLLDGQRGKGGAMYLPNHGLCLEPQHFPDSPNHLNFPSTVLRPGEAYSSTILYRFSAH